MTTFEELLKWLDATLPIQAEDEYGAGPCAIALDLCGLLTPHFDELQAEALVIAKAFWAGAASEKSRLAALKRIAERTDAARSSIQEGTRAQILDRLVFCALVTTISSSVMSAEYLVELAENLEVSPADAIAAFERNLPGLRPFVTR